LRSNACISLFAWLDLPLLFFWQVSVLRARLWRWTFLPFARDSQRTRRASASLVHVQVICEIQVTTPKRQILMILAVAEGRCSLLHRDAPPSPCLTTTFDSKLKNRISSLFVRLHYKSIEHDHPTSALRQSSKDCLGSENHQVTTHQINRCTYVHTSPYQHPNQRGQ